MDKRREERVSTALPVFLDDVVGTTCDVSASGMLFETSASFAVGESIDFTVEFDAPGGKRVLKCRGQIIRTEQRSGRIGVGIKISESIMGLVRLDHSPVTR